MLHYIILASLSTIIMISYLLGIISNKIKVPSALLLILWGMLLNFFLNTINVHLQIPFTAMQMIGTLGLILIVLEGSLDLKIRKEKIGLILNTFIFSVLDMTILSLALSFILTSFYNISTVTALINAVPLSIVSSAIVFPSVDILPKKQSEFLIYNSIFSDILGVLIFTFLIHFDGSSHIFIITALTSLMISIVMSFLLSILLIFILGNFKHDNKIIFILASVIFLYCIGKLFHLSSLMLVFTFGIMLNNYFSINKKLGLMNYNVENIGRVLNEFRTLVREFSFIIRTLFFFIFGFSISIASLTKNNVLLMGFICIILIYFLRYILLTLVKLHSTIKVLIAPRGLITILLIYTIPQNYAIQSFDMGIILFSVIVTNIIMVIGLQLHSTYQYP